MGVTTAFLCPGLVGRTDKAPVGRAKGWEVGQRVAWPVGTTRTVLHPFGGAPSVVGMLTLWPARLCSCWLLLVLYVLAIGVTAWSFHPCF